MGFGDTIAFDAGQEIPYGPWLAFLLLPSLKIWGIVFGREVGRMWPRPASFSFAEMLSKQEQQPAGASTFPLYLGGEMRPAALLPSGPD